MNVSQDVKVIKTLFDLGEIVDNLLLLLSDKEKYVVTKRFNLDGKGKKTLEEIGEKYSVTRERIRQIERNALAKMKRNVFNTALKDLHEFVLNVVNLHGLILKEEELVSTLTKLTQGEIEINPDFAHLAFVLHDSLDCIGNTINFHPYVRVKTIPDYSLKFAANKIVNQLHKYGDIRPLQKLNIDLSATFKELDFSLITIRSLIDIDKRVTLLENDFVGLLEWRHIHPKTLREKILYVLKRHKEAMHFTEIADSISELSFDSRSVNLQAVHNELIRHENFVLIGRGIYALKEWGYEKGTVVEVIEKVLNKHKELSVDEIVDMVLSQRQIKRITILLALKNSEKFNRVGRKRYALKVNS